MANRVGRPSKHTVHGRTTWRCAVCAAIFSRKYGLTKHLRNIHHAPQVMLDYKTREGYPMWARLEDTEQASR